MTATAPASFVLTAEDVLDWLSGRSLDLPGFPVPADTYHPGPIKWGSNPKRGRAIQRSRAAKQLAANAARLRELLPSITFATPQDALDVSRTLQDPQIATAAGWQHWQKGPAASWIHETDTPRLQQAAALGAIRTL